MSRTRAQQVACAPDASSKVPILLTLCHTPGSTTWRPPARNALRYDRTAAVQKRYDVLHNERYSGQYNGQYSSSVVIQLSSAAQNFALG